MTDTVEPTVLARTERAIGHLTLNRPRAINALDLDMIEQLSAALDRWESDPDVELVLLDGADIAGMATKLLVDNASKGESGKNSKSQRKKH